MQWLTVVEWLARVILVLLILLSFWSVSIMIERRRFFRSLHLDSAEIKKSIREKRLQFHQDSYYRHFLSEVKGLKTSEQIDKVFDSYSVEARTEMEKGLSILGTLGSTTPFIGLLGTVLGIIVSFGELSRGAGSTNSVMFSLAEALILTAMGLVVAIPAVIAFNFFNKKVRGILGEASGIKDLYIAYKE
jgi:biopolymer transport protein ExbB